jgi:hypothetical protein
MIAVPFIYSGAFRFIIQEKEDLLRKYKKILKNQIILLILKSRQDHLLHILSG